MKVKGFLKDVSGASLAIKEREQAIEQAENNIKEDKIAQLASSLHPGKIDAVVSDIIPLFDDVKKIVFSSPLLPYFRAGTYLTVELDIGASHVTRAYSIVSSPVTSFKEKTIEIIVKKEVGGFVSEYLVDKLQIGDKVKLEVGLGDNYIDKFRDKKNIVCIAGGIGITPFLSIAKDVKDNKKDINLVLLVGNEYPDKIIAKEELDELDGDNIKVVHVISNDDTYKGEKGFIDEKILRKYSLEDCSYFFCGPKIMYNLVVKSLINMNYDVRRIRHDTFTIMDVSKEEGFKKENISNVFNIEVHQGKNVFTIKGRGNEPIAVALERYGYHIHTRCRGGSCGICRIKILEGKYFIPKDNDFRRKEDKNFSYVHACVAYPESDLIIKINIE